MGINYDEINTLYYKWLNAHDETSKRELKEKLVNSFSTYEFLSYCCEYGYSYPLEIFREVFSLDDLFLTLDSMKEQGEDISRFTSQLLIIKSPEDIKSMNRSAQQQHHPEVSDIAIRFFGSDVFKYGDFKSIGEKFPKAHIFDMPIEEIESMVKSKKDHKGIPITITIDNVGELSLEKLTNIEKYFDVGGVKIQDKKRIGMNNAGTDTPLNLETYRRIRETIDEIVSNLYVNENLDKMHTDYQLAVQIIDIISQRVDYDYEAEKEILDGTIDSSERFKVSSMVGLLTEKTVCKGYSEILRNVLSCVGIESQVVDGRGCNDVAHSWNQIKLGDNWYNVDLTYASRKLREGKNTGDLFMADSEFLGQRRKMRFTDGKHSSIAIIGGHSDIDRNHKQCKETISPYITDAFINQFSRHYAEEYKAKGSALGYRGPVPYIGSSVEKKRSKTKNIEANDHSGR